jgi:glutathione S-transferase
MDNLTLIIGNKNYSSWSLRPWLSLKQANLAFQEIRIPLYTADAPAQIYQYSPAGKVPILIHGATTVWESLAICDYLAELFPAAIWWPEDARMRAIARSISAEMHAGFTALRENMPMNCRASLPGIGLTEAVRRDIERITTMWRDCRQQFGSNGEFLFGPFSIADAMYAPVVLRFKTYGVPVDPICQSYCESIQNLPAMQEWLQAAAAETEVIAHYDTLH